MRNPPTDTAIARRRLLNQQIARPQLETPVDLVRWFGAVQAQDYLGSLWAVGLRLTDAAEPDVERAIGERTIVRTWPLRGTLHYVGAEDVRWILALLTPRAIARSAGRYRELELDDRAFARAGTVLRRALQGGRSLTRHEAYAAIERGGISTAGQRGIHILGHLAQQGLICFGPRRGRQPTFVLLDEWVPPSRQLPREEALATLAARYFASHGPATVQDFAWWAGLLLEEAQAAVEMAGPGLREEARDAGSWWSASRPVAGRWRGPLAALLPPWDEYVVAYKDRTAAFGHPHADQSLPAMAIGKSLVVLDGRVRGTWKRTLTASRVSVGFDFWTPVSAAERRAVDEAADRYARFLGRRRDRSPS